MTSVASEMTITTLSELLNEGHSDYLVYDLGRRVQPIANDAFHAMCQQQRPYPFPVQQQAWFAIAFWPKLSNTDSQVYLWFLKLPLDERGLLSLAAQQEYITQVITLLGNQITGALNEQQQQQLQQSAYLFTPAESKRAALHASLNQYWQRPASIYFEHAQSELCNPTQDGWRTLGVQGIHDVCARLNEHPVTLEQLAHNFSSYPPELSRAVAEALEHITPPKALVTALLSQLTQATEEQRLQVLRALAGAAEQEEVKAAIANLIPEATEDELVVLCARLWPTLAGANLEAYLLRLAELQQPKLFAGVVRDMLSLPELRAMVLGLFHRQDLPSSLQQAWQHFIGQA